MTTVTSRLADASDILVRPASDADLPESVQHWTDTRIMERLL